MKLQVIFLKKKFIYYSLAIILIVITFVAFLCFGKASITTFNIIDESKMIQTDLTGNGTKDILYIKTEKDKYYVQINAGDKSYYLEPSKQTNTVGNYCIQWPMRLTLMDVSRDNIPEIFTQASLGDTTSIQNKAISHVFLWNGEKFDDILCNTNNILGFVDSKNNKIPKVISGNIKDGKATLVSYIFIKNNLKAFDYNYVDNYMGNDTILGFVNLMSSFPIAELNISRELFSPDLNGNALSLLNDLSKEKLSFHFQDAVFKDYKWDKDGNANEVLWTLSFKGTNMTASKEIKNYTIELILKLTPMDNQLSTFKISSIKIK